MVDIPNDEELVNYDEDDEEDQEEDPEEDPEEEPKQNNGHGNQFAQHPNPLPGNMNGWLEEDDDVNANVNNEDIEDEDVEIEVDDDAKLIFPYEVEGDQTPPPRDESSDSESEDEEIDVAPEVDVAPEIDVAPEVDAAPEVDVASEATVRTVTQRLLLFVTFRGALRRDLEASRARARQMKAKLGTCQTEIALLKSKNKIREKERELLNHDLENVKRALGNVLERVS
ncbi:hypothetical protein Tco_1371904, partial [Tanacetum coccineum]